MCKGTIDVISFVLLPFMFLDKLNNQIRIS